jgi:hypothetical protein
VNEPAEKVFVAASLCSGRDVMAGFVSTGQPEEGVEQHQPRMLRLETRHPELADAKAGLKQQRVHHREIDWVDVVRVQLRRIHVPTDPSPHQLVRSGQEVLQAGVQPSDVRSADHEKAPGSEHSADFGEDRSVGLEVLQDFDEEDDVETGSLVRQRLPQVDGRVDRERQVGGVAPDQLVVVGAVMRSTNGSALPLQQRKELSAPGAQVENAKIRIARKLPDHTQNGFDHASLGHCLFFAAASTRLARRRLRASRDPRSPPDLAPPRRPPPRATRRALPGARPPRIPSSEAVAPPGRSSPRRVRCSRRRSPGRGRVSPPSSRSRRAGRARRRGSPSDPARSSTASVRPERAEGSAP